MRRTGGRPAWRWISVAFFSVATFRMVPRSMRCSPEDFCSIRGVFSCGSAIMVAPSVRFDGRHHAQDLLEGDDAFPGLDQGILEQGAHAMAACGLRQVARTGLIKDKVAQVVVHLHHLMNTGTPEIP